MSDVLEIFESACRAASKISLPRQLDGKVEIAIRKQDGDFATTSDIDAGTVMETIIKDSNLHVPIVPEENKTGESGAKFRADRQAILDEGTFILMDDLDATVRYHSGGEDWGHMLGLVENGVLTHCAMYMPAREVMLTAKRSEGCFVNGKRQRLDQSLAIDKCILYLPFHKDIDPSFYDQVTKPILFQAKPAGCVCFNSNIGGVVRLVQGELGGFIGCGHNWDFVGALAVIEAGGIAVSPAGGELRWDQIPMIMVAAANHQIAKAMLEVTTKYPHYDDHFFHNPKFTS